MEKEHCLPQSYVDLISRRYGIKILDNHYVLVDDKFKRYNLMLDAQLTDSMVEKLHQKYAGKTSAMHVAWEERPSTNSIRFFAEVGNNIVLLWDTLVED